MPGIYSGADCQAWRTRCVKWVRGSKCLILTIPHIPSDANKVGVDYALMHPNVGAAPQNDIR